MFAISSRFKDLSGEKDLDCINKNKRLHSIGYIYVGKGESVLKLQFDHEH